MRGSAFFDGIHQIDMDMGGRPGRTPVFYYDGSGVTGVFPARLGELRRLMPDSRYVPARLAPGLGVVSITAFEYRDTDIGPYNELVIMILLNMPAERPNLPGRALWDSVVRPERVHGCVIHMPVTTSVALSAGVDFYNFPKSLADIEVVGTRAGPVCRVAQDGEPILTLAGAAIATPPGATRDVFSHLFMDGQTQSAQFRMRAVQQGVSRRPGAAQIVLGPRHPVARLLDHVLVGRRSIHYELMPRIEGVLFGPDRLTMPLIDRALRATDVEAAAGVPAH